MMKSLQLIFLLLALTIAGCASMKEAANPTAESLLSETAGAIGKSPDDVEIVSVRKDGSWTYYTAQTGNEAYACRVMSGGGAAMTTIGTFGMMTQPPICVKQ